MDNIFSMPGVCTPDNEEFFETLLRGAGRFRVERIISHGHTTAPGEWYDQQEDEWVIVLEGDARIAYEDGTEVRLARGDHLFLPRRVKHRVSHTSSPCVWLALFGNISMPTARSPAHPAGRQIRSGV
ncbi:cupin domain-containing protein [Desulfovibrio sp. OttesenSCG-928-I05]|nr:cupin domain-containing protein [Desulfovibrio sp. OttesenSCG-928-I05]